MIGFGDMITRHLAREKRTKDVGRYYPSEIGGCLRKVWFSYRFPKDVDPEVIKIFHLGNMIHDFVAEVMKSEKNPEVTLVGEEVPFTIEDGDFTISGRIDDIVMLEGEDEKILVEVKSTKMTDILDGPKDEHVMQLQLYMYAMKIFRGIVLYIEKNTLKTKEFEVKYDQNSVNEVMKRFRALHANLKAETVPPAEAKENPDKRWMCKYCDYLEECQRAEIDGN
ncbi:MAG: CRISPR-associated protein Cas4 [Candidatus Aenigmarchaeota archaeon]|nr:CRISPR-associated protein Cas4 [Candidatus Aenigmarchaeota archaeon]